MADTSSPVKTAGSLSSDTIASEVTNAFSQSMMAGGLYQAIDTFLAAGSASTKDAAS